MADIVLGSITEFLVETTISLGAKEANRVLGLKKNLSNMRKKLKLIQAVLRDAESQQQTKEAVKRWLKELENWAFEADDVFDEFNYESHRRKMEIGNQMKRKIAFFFSCSNPIVFRVKMAHKIQKRTLSLTEIIQESKDFNLQPESDGGVGSTDRFPSQDKFMINRDSDSTDVGPEFVGRDDIVSKMVEQLIVKKDEVVSVIPIVGMGGIGKTTLAKRLYNDPKIQQHFASRIWVCVSIDFEVNRLLKLILQSLGKHTTKEERRDAMVKVLRDELKDNRYLLVLDDVWDNSGWREFQESLKGITNTKGNCILVTTRQQQVASSMGTPSSSCFLENLSDNECWLILKKKAFDSGEVPPGLERIGLEIAQKCQGLPLAASVLGGMLRNKETHEWLSILNSGLQASGGDENRIMHILRLSYDHLPHPALKKCFAYLSIFPKDFSMERDNLIQLWIAEGFLHPDPGTNMEMEDVGDKFFNIFLQYSLLQEKQTDDYGNVLCCNMHDLVHDLALTISGSKTANLKDSRRNEDDGDSIRYLALGDKCGKEMSSNMERFRLVRTLFLDGHIAQEILSYPISLRVLKLSSSHVEALPNSVAKLIHLRYLDLSSSYVKDLPDFICKLYNLQTLIVGETKLPNTLKDLVNLRYLDYSASTDESYTPLGLRCLTSLRFLPFFNVSQEKGRQLEELRNLKYLRRSLKIYNLELVNGREEARQANLCEKPNLDELRFIWKEDRTSDNQDTEVLEGLEPHKNLKGLVIKNFLGNHLSPWITKLDRLMKMKLKNCKVKELPALGHLPFLFNLELVDLDDVTCICPCFPSAYNCGGSSKHSDTTGQLVKRIFPALKSLSLKGMPKLIEWVEANNMPTTGVVFFPVLEELTIKSCGNLASFPNPVPRLKMLYVNDVMLESSTLAKICSQTSALTYLLLYKVGRLVSLPDSMLFNMPNLRTLEMVGCEELIQMWKADDDEAQDLEVENCEPLGQSRDVLPSVEELDIQWCNKLQSIQIPNGHQCLASLRSLRIAMCETLTHISSELVKSTTSLETLRVCGCPELVSFPIDLQNLTTLSRLEFLGCENCSMPEGLSFLTRLGHLELSPLSSSTEYHSTLYLSNAFQNMSSLRYLELWGFESWDSLPDQLQYLSALESLDLYDFGVKRLPDWFEKLASLRDLKLAGFKELEYLPSEQSMRRLKLLKELQISNCPKLKERLAQQSVPNCEGLKISHIPDVEIDGAKFKITP